ncbi:MAG: hypothetical protein CVT49_12535 [candidate division Zixibacteria bacterium HGW-Zixibacteria-1]|nr:MAG: hypothetical protein CVT49_12535 [candidate division Zixibacteria bacterium HGW-Zixibacteria-1]
MIGIFSKIAILFILIFPINTLCDDYKENKDTLILINEVVYSNTINNCITKGISIDLTNCTIIGRLQYQKDTIHSRIKITNSTLKDDLNWNTMHFRSPVEINGCTIFGKIDMYNVNFESDVIFKDCIFVGLASFSKCHFSKAYFDGSEFQSKISFYESDFIYAADFGRVKFCRSADFEGARFIGYSMVNVSRDTGETPFIATEAAIWHASVSFYKASLINAEFKNCILQNAIISPTFLDDYTMESLANAKSLKDLQFVGSNNTLITLKNFFRNNNYRQKEREITCAMERRNQSTLKKVIFDLPFEYGSNLARPFQIVFAIYLFCAGIYFIMFHFAGVTGVLFKKMQIDPRTNREHESALRIGLVEISNLGGFLYFYSFVLREIRLLMHGCFFSLISTFNLGFREIDFGRWLRLILPWKAEYQPFGFVKTISGLQSIISVLLMAFGLLFYYGRFFE